MQHQPTEQEIEIKATEHAKDMARRAVEMERKMREYAIKYRKRHPKVSPRQLTRIVAKKFNVKLT